jgi:ribokinase
MVKSFVVIGSIKYDTVCTIDRFPRVHEKVREATITTCLGGSAANTAAWLAWLGSPVRLVGTVGDDETGKACLAMIRAAAVSCMEVAVDPTKATGRAVCLSTRRAKRIVTSSGPPLDPALDLLRGTSGQYTDSVVHIAAQETSELIAVCHRLRREGATISVELNGRRMDSIREVATIAFLNHDELTDVFGLSWQELDVSSLTMILPNPDARLIVTLGRDGALCVERTGITRVPARRIRIVERTGGGDAFNAGFLAAYAHDCDVETSLRAGTESATLALSRVGGQPL